MAVFLGWAASLVIIVAVEALGHWLFPLPAGTEVWDKAALAEAARNLPVGALLAVIAGWTLGALGGGFLAARLSGIHQRRHALVVAGIVLLFAVWTMLTIPHPAWMWVATIVLVPAAGWLAGGAAGRMSSVT